MSHGFMNISLLQEEIKPNISIQVLKRSQTSLWLRASVRRCESRSGAAGSCSSGSGHQELASHCLAAGALKTNGSSALILTTRYTCRAGTFQSLRSEEERGLRLSDCWLIETSEDGLMTMSITRFLVDVYRSG
ncbi:hypothetical protein E1301_Tti017952 [Triplophysa tibetana]|uniref:Uncharacterized protein n=1 Tax=Triplophysa tibetana TaxID=1572043 RepID=A0A5A9ND51_9TELE|nr:hypothetical protein E1301_Tti017952 [Triplophysa tibetana]